MDSKKSSRFKIISGGKVTRLEPVEHKVSESVEAVAQSVTAVTGSLSALISKPTDTAMSYIDLSFSPKRLGEALLDIYQVTDALRLILASADPSLNEARTKDIQWVLALAEQQLNFRRRDHARSERMLDVYCRVRNRLETACGINDQHGDNRCIDVSIGINIDCQLTELLSRLMYLAAAHNPDDSAYSQHWREVLMAHAADLRLIVSAVLNGRPLISPHYVRLPQATGRFVLPSRQTQAEVLKELEQDYGYTVLKSSGPTAVCCSRLAKQIVLVGENGARQDIAMLHLINDDNDLPNVWQSVLVSRNSPPLVVYVRQSGGIRRLRYSWSTLRYH